MIGLDSGKMGCMVYIGKDLIYVGMVGCEFVVCGWEEFFIGVDGEGSRRDRNWV